MATKLSEMFKLNNEQLDGMVPNEKLLLKCQAMVEEAFEARKDRTDSWQKNERLYIGNPADQEDTRSNIKHAIATAVIEDEMPTFRDYISSIDVLGDQQNDTFFADMMNRRMKQLLESAMFMDKFIDVIKNGHIYSDGVVEILPVLKPKNGVSEEEYENMDEEERLENSTLADIDISVVDTMGYFPDPMGDGWTLGKSRYVILAEVLPIKDIEAKYDIAEGVIKGGNFDIADFKGFSTAESYIRGSSQYSTMLEKIKKDYAVVFKIYWNCPASMSANYEGSEELGKTVAREAKEYPNGRCTIFTENTILYDEPIELPVNPVFGYKNYSVPGKLYGIGETELAAPGNFLTNYITSNMADNVADFGNPKRKIKRSLYNRLEGSIRKIKNIPVDDMSDFSYAEAQNIPSSTFNVLEFSRQLLDQVTGAGSILQGKPPTGVQSGIAIRALYEASQTRIRHKITHDVNPEFVKIGRYIAWLIQTYDEEVSTIRGELVQTGETKFYEYDPVGKYYFDEQKKQFVKADPHEMKDNLQLLTLRDAKINIRVEPGSGGALGRAAKALESLELFSQGLYPFSRLVNDLNIEDKAELIAWYDSKNSAKQLLARMQTIAKQYSGQQTVKSISNSNVQQQLYDILMQTLELDIAKL